MNISARIREYPFQFIVAPLVLALLALSSFYNYLLFHSIAELFSVVVAACIFVVAWNSRHILKNSLFMFLGIAYLFVGSIDLVHTLAYPGMGVFQGYGTNLATQFWIIGRYMESISLLASFMFINRKLDEKIQFAAYSAVTLLLLSSVFYWEVFPDCFIEGSGLTAFKKASEYIISFILVSTLLVLHSRREELDPGVIKYLYAAVLLTIASELAFTFYISAYGLSNMIGHLLKVVSFYLIYRALVVNALIKPLDMLLEELRRNEDRFKRIFDKAPVGAAMVNLDGSFERVNDRMCEILGYSKEELSDLTFMDITHPDDLEEGMRNTKALIAGEIDQYKADKRYVRKDGRVLWGRLSLRALSDADGSPICLLPMLEDIDEQKHAVEELHKLSQAIEQCPTSVVITDFNGKIEYVNSKFSEKSGYMPGEVLGKSLRTLNSGAISKEVYKEMMDVLSSGKVWKGEHNSRKKSGELYWEHATISPIRNANGESTHLITITEDITENIQILEALEMVFNAAPVPLTISQFTDGNIIKLNKLALDFLDISYNETLELSIASFFANPEDREIFFREMSKTGVVTGFEVEMKRPWVDESRWFLLSSHIIEYFGEKAILTGFLEITERKTMEDELSNAKEELEQIFNLSADMICVLDLDEITLKKINPSFSSILGYRDEELLNKPLLDFVDPRDKDKTLEAIDIQLSCGEPIMNFECRYICKDGSFKWLSWSSRPVPELGTAYAIAHDISERKEYERTLKKQNKELVSTRGVMLNMMEDLDEVKKAALDATHAKSDFLANMSHELRTPLNSIIGFSEVMQDGMTGPMTDDQQRYLGNIYKSGRHLLALIDDILDLSKVEAGKMELDLSDFSLHELLEGSLVMFRERAMKHDIALHTDMAKDIGSIRADQRKIKQVVYNLLSNAMKFTPDGGKVGIRATRDSDEIRVAVWDTGPGIQEEDMHKLFQAFSQLETTLTKEHPGTGLGLNLSRKLVELHGGELSVESEFGSGAEFSFTIPLARGGNHA
jgi:PAS domain S-box-containing protein